MTNDGLTCERCRAVFEENAPDQEPPCDISGENCAQRAIQLSGDDDLAFDLFILARKRGVGELILSLESWEFNRARAADIAQSIRIFDGELTEIEERERKQSERHRK